MVIIYVVVVLFVIIEDGLSVIIESVMDIKSHPIFYKMDGFIPTELLLKIEGLNIAKSIKLKTARHMLEVHEQKGAIIKNKSKIICSSSGNLAIALAIICKEKKYPMIAVVDPNTNLLSKNIIPLYDGELIEVTERDSNGGFLKTRINLINKMLEEDKYLFWINQYDDPENYYAHYYTTASEILQEVPDITHLFIGAGTTGTLMGCAKYFRQYSPKTKIIAVDSVGSMTFSNVPAKRYIPGLGTSIAPSIANKDMVDDIIWIQEIDTIRTCYEVLKKFGLWIGGSTGTVLHAVRQYSLETSMNKIVAISPDFGDAYLESVYNSNWIRSKYNRDIKDILHEC